MDLQSRVRWEQYTLAKEETFRRTHSEESPWNVIKGNDKRRARLNCMHHLCALPPPAPAPAPAPAVLLPVRADLGLTW